MDLKYRGDCNGRNFLFIAQYDASRKEDYESGDS